MHASICFRSGGFLRRVVEDLEATRQARLIFVPWHRKTTSSCGSAELATEVAAACLEYGARTLCLKRISATVDVRHIASQRVLEKLGFAYRKTIENDDGTTDKYYVVSLD